MDQWVKILLANGSNWRGLLDIEKIYDFLYKDATVFLERKKETFDKVVSITKTKIKYRK
jgi:predicted acetyltransferase